MFCLYQSPAAPGADWGMRSLVLCPNFGRQALYSTPTRHQLPQIPAAITLTETVPPFPPPPPETALQKYVTIRSPGKFE